MAPDPTQLIDRSWYPIHDLDDPRTRALADRYRRTLRTTRVAIAPGFLTPAAVDAMVAESAPLGATGHHRDVLRGPRSLHRVTPIGGDTARLVALLAYDTKPGTCSSELLRLVRYGRATARTN